MNAKYAQKPKANPNEPTCRDKSSRIPLRVRDLLILAVGSADSTFLSPCVLVFLSSYFYQNEPNRLATPVVPATCPYRRGNAGIQIAVRWTHQNEAIWNGLKTLISRQKRGNGGQKVRQKNETNPIVDNFVHPEPACTASGEPVEPSLSKYRTELVEVSKDWFVELT